MEEPEAEQFLLIQERRFVDDQTTRRTAPRLGSTTARVATVHTATNIICSRSGRVAIRASSQIAMKSASTAATPTTRRRTARLSSGLAAIPEI